MDKPLKAIRYLSSEPRMATGILIASYRDRITKKIYRRHFSWHYNGRLHYEALYAGFLFISLVSGDQKLAGKYLIWNTDRMKFWKPHRVGYTSDLVEAGIYKKSDALAETDKGNVLDDADRFIPVDQFFKSSKSSKKYNPF